MPATADEKNQESHHHFEAEALNQRFIRDNSSWLERHIIRRLAWVLIAVFSFLLFPAGAFYALTLIFKPYQAWQALKNSLLASLGFTLFSVINIFYPGVANKRIMKEVIMGKVTGNYDYFKAAAVLQGVKSDKGCVDTLEIKVNPRPLAWSDTEFFEQGYTIHFLGNAACYQEEIGDFVTEANHFGRNVRVINYPGVNPSHPGDYSLESTQDLINAGIAAIYHLADSAQKPLTFILNDVQLAGHSMGGAVALRVALYFKEKYNTDIPVHVNRSFSSLCSVIGALGSRLYFLPEWFSTKLVSLIFYASGIPDLDNVAVLKKLKPEQIHYINVGHEADKLPSIPKSIWDRLYEYCFVQTKDADAIIPDSASLTYVLSSGTTKELFEKLGYNIEKRSHLIFASDPSISNMEQHNMALNNFEDIAGKNALDQYKEDVVYHTPKWV